MVRRVTPSAKLIRPPRQVPFDHRAAEPGLPDYAPSPPASETPVGIAELGAILKRRWLIIASTTALITLTGLGYAMTAKSLYTASTAIFVDPRARASFQIEGSGTGAGYDPNLVDSQTIVIESESVLRRVIEAEKLTEDSEFARGPAEPATNALRNLQEAVKVRRPDRTYVVEIQVRTQDGAKSARIANAVAKAYLSDGKDSKAETAQREQSWLDTHLQNLQARLKEAEARVDAYKTENRIIGSEGKLVGEQQLTELNRGLVDAQRKAAEAKALLDQVEELKKSGRMPDTTVDALKSSVIDRLRGQMAEVLRLEANARTTLGPRHPAALEIREQIIETRRAINEELGRVAEGARSNFAVARNNVAALERQLELLKKDSTNTSRTLLRLRELERAVDAQKAVFEKFLRDKEQIARLTVDTPAGRVIAPAVAPQYRSFPNRPLILMLSLLAGLLIGIGLALAVETLSRARRPSRLRLQGSSKAPGPFAPDPFSPDFRDTTPLAMLPRAGAAPGLRWVNRRAAPPAGPALDAVDRAPGSAYAREVAGLAGKIRTMLDDGVTTTLMISGAKPDAGSPVLAANLARALAATGARVLLVDGSGGRASLSERLAGAGSPSMIEVGNQKRLAIHLPSRGNTLFFLPFGGLRNTRSMQRPSRGGACTLVIIDGPAMGSAALEKIDLEARVDGVIALLPPGTDPAHTGLAAALDTRFGAALIGVVGQAA